MSTVQEMIDAAEERTAEAISDSEAFITSLESLADSYEEYPASSYQFYDIGNVLEVGSVPPDLEDINRNTDIGIPNVNTTVDIPLWNEEAIPDFTDARQTIDLPSLPTNSLPETPVDFDSSTLQSLTAPVVDNHDLPPLPDVELPALVSLSVADIPLWDISAPEIDFVTPTNNFSFTETEYSSDLKDKINELLADDLANGGYGITTSDEEAVYQRARDREEINTLKAETEVADTFAAKGFVVPPGAALFASQMITEQRDKNLSTVNRDIALQRSELSLKSRQFAISQSVGWETTFINLHNSKMERALNYERATAEFGLQYYNASVEFFNLKVNLYNALSQGFQRRLDAARTKIEEDKLKIANHDSGLRRSGLILERYKAELDGSKMLYEFYNTQIRAVSLNTDIEKVKLAAYREQIESFLTNVKLKAFELDHYKASIQGEQLKLDDFKNAIAAHTTKVDRIKTSVGIKRQRFDAEINEKRLELENISQQLDKYRIEIKTAFDDENLKLNENNQEISIWKSTLASNQSNRQGNIQVAVANQTSRLNVLKIRLQHLQDDYNHKIKGSDIRVGASKAGLQLYENLIAGAENSLSAIAVQTAEQASV